MSYRTISCEELFKLSQDTDVDVVDVRTPAEYGEVHATCARNAPLEALDPQKLMEARNGHADQPLYVICRSGSRSTKACDAFVKAGYSNIVNVDGGTAAWESAGLPVVRGKKAISLERQVRIAAGGLVFAGAVLALTVHPYWAGLSAFVGAGLMFAGITDTCGMAMALAKMPWNQAGGSGVSCSR